MRVLVEFGHRKVVGVVTQFNLPPPEKGSDSLKTILQILDKTPYFDTNLYKLVSWCASYYGHPLGDSFHIALPNAMRLIRTTERLKETQWELIERDFEPPKRATAQTEAIKHFQDHNLTLKTKEIRDLGISSAVLRTLEKKKVLRRVDQIAYPTNTLQAHEHVQLNAEQTESVKQISSSLDVFKATLLYGITGSGKTEVYIEIARRVIGAKKQVLILVPEINLTPQTAERFEKRLGISVLCLHSGLTEKLRWTYSCWAIEGRSQVIIGTRSSVFLKLPQLGLIVVDEEHDRSYEQTDGFKYSARNVAIKRAQIENIPIILGSATPSSESYWSALEGRYQFVQMKNRPLEASLPSVHLIDLNQGQSNQALHPNTLSVIGQTLDLGKQVIIMLNRRGYAPSIVCATCSGVMLCNHCDARMNYHAQDNTVKCHHCGAKQSPPSTCQSCGSAELLFMGTGTQRVESQLAALFPNYAVIRIDRDSVRNPRELDYLRGVIGTGEPCLIVGTQMVAKGHDFSKVSLVVVVEADHMFFSANFKATEQAAQLIIQASGRSGRRESKGQVLIQTRFPEHPLFDYIKEHNYSGLIEEELDGRRHCRLPPFSRMITIRAESKNSNKAKQTLIEFMNLMKASLQKMPYDSAGPLDAHIQKKQGIFRSLGHYYLHDAASLNAFLTFYPRLQKQLQTSQVRLQMDIDPADYL